MMAGLPRGAAAKRLAALGVAFALAVLAAGPLASVLSAQTAPTPPKSEGEAPEQPGPAPSVPPEGQTGLTAPGETVSGDAASTGGPQDVASAPVGSQSDPDRDAKSYADEFGVSVDEAKKRLKKQKSAGELDKKLQENEKRSFAGLWIKHADNGVRVQTRFTHGGQDKVQPYLEGTGLSEEEIDVLPADATLTELEAARETAQRNAQSQGIRVNTDINVKTNRVELLTTADNTMDSASTGSNLVEVKVVEGLDEPKLYGGLGLYSSIGTLWCTTGFSVYDPYTGLYGTTTAAHCPPKPANFSLYRGGEWQPYKWAVYGGSYDIQFHSTPSTYDSPSIKDGSSSWRWIYGSKRRSSTAVNSYLCQYGANYGYGCGLLVSKVFDPGWMSYSPYNWPDDNPTFYRVRSKDWIAGSGDSGGPLFNSGTAYGTLVSGRCYTNYCYGTYMPMDYFYGTGIKLLVR